MGKVYPTKASSSQSLPSMQTKIPRELRQLPKSMKYEFEFFGFLFTPGHIRLKGTLRYNGGKWDNFRMHNCSV